MLLSISEPACGELGNKIKLVFRIFNSIKKKGYSVKSDLEKQIILFCADKIYFRIDGSHRSAIMKFLGYSEIPITLITPSDLLKLENDLLISGGP